MSAPADLRLLRDVSMTPSADGVVRPLDGSRLMRAGTPIELVSREGDVIVARVWMPTEAALDDAADAIGCMQHRALHARLHASMVAPPAPPAWWVAA